MSDVDEIHRIRHRIEMMEQDAWRTLAAQMRAAGDDTHYFRASLQHYTDWLTVNSFATPDRDLVGAYLDAMNGRSWPRRFMRRSRKVLQAVRREQPQVLARRNMAEHANGARSTIAKILSGESRAI
jgi:hypothetical protein